MIAAVLVCGMVGFGALAFGGSITDLDEKNGFRDLKCGDALPEGMRMTEESGDEKYYTRQESLTIGAGTVTEIAYGFYKGQLGAVQIRTKGLINSNAVQQAFEAAYGHPTQPNRFLEHYYWLGEKVSLAFKQNPVTNDALAIILCKSIQEKKKQDNQIKAQKGKGDL
ncbi:MAG: hypothetical protein KGL31_07560 [candidate division NC10 bacterium]|nr:hypothetical protein [candidate division NC10 bacterium]MDE2321759.1 hypothetical protein [candidate division NC10 bacterium]